MLLNVPAPKTRSPTGWIASTRGTPCEALVVVAGPIPHVRAGAAVTAASAAASATTHTTLRCHLGTIALPFHPTTGAPVARAHHYAAGTGPAPRPSCVTASSAPTPSAGRSLHSAQHHRRCGSPDPNRRRSAGGQQSLPAYRGARAPIPVQVGGSSRDIPSPAVRPRAGRPRRRRPRTPGAAPVLRPPALPPPV